MNANLVAQLPVSVQTITLLVASNLFMPVACHGHLKHQANKRCWQAVLLSRGIALLASLLQCRPSASVMPAVTAWPSARSCKR